MTTTQTACLALTLGCMVASAWASDSAETKRRNDRIYKSCTDIVRAQKGYGSGSGAADLAARDQANSADISRCYDAHRITAAPPSSR